MAEKTFAVRTAPAGDYIPTGESKTKYEYDVRIKVVKIKHDFYYHESRDCAWLSGRQYRLRLRPDPVRQYTSGALSLANTINAPITKTILFLSGITNSEITPCGGYVTKLQGREAKILFDFREDLLPVL